MNKFLEILEQEAREEVYEMKCRGEIDSNDDEQEEIDKVLEKWAYRLVNLVNGEG